MSQGSASASEPTASPLGSCEAPLVTAYDCAMLDLDGVVYLGPQVVEGVPRLLDEARSAGMKLAYVTNNASRPAPAVAAHLRDLGIAAEDSDVVTSAQAAAREIADRCGAGARVLVIGGEGLVWALRERGLEPVTSRDGKPVAVVQGFHPSVGWQQLAEGAAAIRNGAWWVASNLDLTFPTPDGPAPGNGALVNAVAEAVGRRPDLVAGKPDRPLFDETVRRVGAHRPLVVGDRLDTDIEGAVRCDTDSLLVMTGVTDVGTLLQAPPQQRATYVAWTLAGLLTPHAAPRRVPDAERRSVHDPDEAGQPVQTATSPGSLEAPWTLNGWTARVEAGRVVVDGDGSDHDDALRVAVAAAWAWQDDHGEPVRAVDGLEPSTG